MLDPLEQPQTARATKGRHRFGMGDADLDWTRSSLEPDWARMLALGGEALQFVMDFIASRASAPASPLEGAAELANIRLS